MVDTENFEGGLPSKAFTPADSTLQDSVSGNVIFTRSRRRASAIGERQIFAVQIINTDGDISDGINFDQRSILMT